MLEARQPAPGLFGLRCKGISSGANAGCGRGSIAARRRAPCDSDFVLVGVFFPAAAQDGRGKAGAFVVGFAPGATTTRGAAWSPQALRALGQSVIGEKARAGGNVAPSRFKRSAPDGNTPWHERAYAGSSLYPNAGYDLSSTSSR